MKLLSTNQSDFYSGVSIPISRRRALGLLGLGVLTLEFQFGCTKKASRKVFDNEKPLYFLTITEISELMKTKKISSVELTTLMLDRITTIDVKLNSYITILKETALSTAMALDKELESGVYRGPLHGVPIAIKDLFYTKGELTTGGTYINKDFIPDFDATVVSRLRDAGAVILGKLNMSEGAWEAHHPEFGDPKNPWDNTRYTGVSSSGSGVATAAGLCFGSLGTDTGGSIRYPSAANGIVGLKPTFGRVSRYGVMPLALSMDHVGPMTRSVTDAAIMYEIIAGADANDPFCLTGDVPKIVDQLNKEIKGLRIGIDHAYASNKVQPQVTSAIKAALELMKSLGAEIVEVKMPEMTNIADAWYKLASREAAGIHASTYPSRAAAYGASFRDVLKAGSALTDDELTQAKIIREGFVASYNKMLETVDAFICPADWCTPGVYADATVPGGQRPIIPNPWDNEIFAAPANFSGCPSLTLPCGFSMEGLPIGVQIIGKNLSEGTICRIGYAYEQNTDWHNKHPKV